MKIMRTILPMCKKNRFTIPVYLFIYFLFLVSPNSNGQTIITGGTTLTVIPGTTFILNNHLILQAGGALNNQGTVILKKDLANGNSGENSLGTGAVVFSGTTGQLISGKNLIQDLTVNNAAGLTVGGNTKVFGVLALTSGLATLGSNNLLLGAGASVSGSPSGTNMIVPNGSGQMQKMFSVPGSFTYPVGSVLMLGTTQYSPVSLVFNSGTFGANSYAGVNLVGAQYPGTGTSYLNRYWNVTQSEITGFSCNATLQYVPADVVGTESDIFSFKVDPLLPWIAYNVADPGTHQITVHGLSSFGTFTGNLGDAAIPPPIRSLQDKTIFTSGMNYCADALQTLLIAGNGTSYVVPTGVSVLHIAGQNIIYYPGAKIVAGGYLHGYISTTFCTPYIHPGAAPVFAGTEDQADPSPLDKGLFRIYPNPTPGKFTLELKGDAASAQVHIDIFGILGERILSKDLLLERKQEFSLADRPTGVYVIRVSSGVNSETKKIIKQ
jgi:hypothetical protein